MATNFPGQGDHLGILLKAVNSDPSGLRSAGPGAPREAEAAGLPWKVLGMFFARIQRPVLRQSAGRGGLKVAMWAPTEGREGRLRWLEGQAEARRLSLETLEVDANTMEGGA